MQLVGAQARVGCRALQGSLVVVALARGLGRPRGGVYTVKVRGVCRGREEAQKVHPVLRVQSDPQPLEWRGGGCNLGLMWAAVVGCGREEVCRGRGMQVCSQGSKGARLWPLESMLWTCQLLKRSP